MTKTITTNTPRPQSVIKHSASIQVNNVVSLLQRKAWNVLLAHAYDELQNKEEYSMPIIELCDMLEYGDSNRDYLKSTLIALNTTQIEWNILGKDGVAEWGTTTFLAGATFKEGKIYWGYYKGLREKLYNPRMYARINLRMQNNFMSKYSLAMYELCIDYYDVKRTYGETPWIPISIFKKLMGVGVNEYQDLRDLKKKLINKPIEDIHSIPDAEINIEVEYKPNRKPDFVKFKISRRPGSSLPAPESPDLFASGLAGELKNLGVTDDGVKELLTRFDEEEIVQWVESLKLGYSKAEKNITGFLISALENGYEIPKGYVKFREEQMKILKNKNERHEKEELGKGRDKIRLAKDQQLRKQWLALTKDGQKKLFDEAIVLLEKSDPEAFDYANKDGLQKYGVPLKEFTVELYENAPIFIRGAILVTINKILEQRGHVVPPEKE